MKDHVAFKLADGWITHVLKWVSLPAGGALAAMAFLATVNVVYSKSVGASIPSTTDWIAYLMIPAVYLCIGYMILDRGLITVDFLQKRFPAWLRDAILVVSYFAGIVINVMVGVNVMQQTSSYYKMHKYSSTQALHFPLWPFYLILGLGMFSLSLALFWGVMRLFVLGNTVANGEKEKGAKEQNEEVRT